MHQQTLLAVWAALTDTAGCLPPACLAAQAVQGAARLLRLPAHEPGPALLRPVFTHLCGEHPGFLQPPAPGFAMPLPEEKAASCPDPAAPLREFEPRAAALPQAPEQLPVLLDLLEQAGGSVACSGSEALRDISLYDLRRMRAACAGCLAEYTREDPVRAGLLQPGGEDALCCEPALLLYSADLSGIQRFIYTVSTQQAMKMLRSRSFFLELLMEHYVDRLLSGCGVSRANLLYQGGGHCYLLLPNTAAAIDCARDWNRRVNNFLLQAFDQQLFLAHGWAVCSADELNDLPAGQGRYRDVFGRLSAALARHKLHRYDAGQLRELNRALPPDEAGRECRVCGRSDQLRPDGLCRWCGWFTRIGERLRQADHCVVAPAGGATGEGGAKTGDAGEGSGRSPGRTPDEAGPDDLVLPLPQTEDSCIVRFLTDAQLQKELAAGLRPLHIYHKNQHKKQPGTVLANGTRLYVAEYSGGGPLNELAGRSEGIARMAVCRMDVDDLGQAFVEGFARHNAAAGAQLVSLLRTAAFSRGMNLLFKGALDELLKKEKLAVTLVYSGGDDLFLAGSWSDAVRAAALVRGALRQYSCGALTISGGIGLFDPHFPIRTAAEQTAELEEEAKALKNKDGITLFAAGMGQTYPWDVFLKEVQGEKLALLQGFFGNEENERGSTMLYNLLELLRGEGQMQLARYAYLLARLEPPRNDPRSKGYRQFSRTMYAWALNKKDRAQLVTAVYLYLYLNRKKEG